jgi:transcriptional regulator with XRE-family HTH domain
MLKTRWGDWTVEPQLDAKGKSAFASVIGRRLAAARQNLGLEQRITAERFGVKEGTYGHWESGWSTIPTEYLPLLRTVLGVTSCWLLGEDDLPMDVDQSAQLLVLFSSIRSEGIRQFVIDTVRAQADLDARLRSKESK